MGNLIHMIGNERRNSNESVEDRNGEERRKSPYIEKEKLEDLLIFLNSKYEKLGEYVTDKEKKKLAIVASSFAVFTFLVTIALGIFKDGINVKEPLAFFSLVMVFLLGIAVINISIIKYIVALKLSWLLAVRQMNCIRQAINTIMFTKIEGYLPHTLTADKIKNEDYENTILDKKSRYWDLYGRHEKYPLNNVHLREKYQSWRVALIWFTSGDFFAISAISVFTILLVSGPAIYLHFFNDIEKLKELYGDKLVLISSSSVIATIIFVSLVTISVISALITINKTLYQDDTFHINVGKDV